jgi:hypothetical protein
MTTSHKPLSFTLGLASCLVLLAACGGDDNKGTASDTADTVTTGSAGDTDPATTSGDTPTTGTVDPTTATTTDASDSADDGTTTNAVDPCDACDANASCQGDQCVCDDGYDGDGETCTDIDECAGKNDCAVDATCANTPGAYECTCNEGYKGNGEDCKDIDECNEDLDNCSMNATCTNQDGSFKCECKDGFNGDGIVCNGSKEFGEGCTAGEDCASGLCLTGDFDMCTITCTQDVANDCGAQGVTGLCVAVGMDTFVCAGDLTFGADKDDEILKSGDSLKRSFQTKTDADLFLLDIAAAGTYQVAAYPDPDDTLTIDFYNGDATELGTVMSPGVGMPAGGNIDVPAAGVFFAVVRNTGNSNGDFTISVMKQ